MKNLECGTLRSLIWEGGVGGNGEHHHPEKKTQRLYQSEWRVSVKVHGRLTRSTGSSLYYVSSELLVLKSTNLHINIFKHVLILNLVSYSF